LDVGLSHANLDQRFLGAVDYEIPADKQVSDQLRDLLKRMLVADPHQRANLLEIEQHPWFRKDIPPDLNVGTFNANYLRLSDSAEHANTIRRQAF
jgi:serine/threonine-protein kinase SRK2